MGERWLQQWGQHRAGSLGSLQPCIKRVRHVVTSVTTWLAVERGLLPCSPLPRLRMTVTRHVNLREAEAQLSRLADAAHQGATVVLTKRGVP